MLVYFFLYTLQLKNNLDFREFCLVSVISDFNSTIIIQILIRNDFRQDSILLEGDTYRKTFRHLKKNNLFSLQWNRIAAILNHNIHFKRRLREIKNNPNLILYHPNFSRNINMCVCVHCIEINCQCSSTHLWV